MYQGSEVKVKVEEIFCPTGVLVAKTLGDTIHLLWTGGLVAQALRDTIHPLQTVRGSIIRLYVLHPLCRNNLFPVNTDGFASVRISKWKSPKNTFGWARAEVLGALVNAVFLIALCFSITIEALKRLVQVEEIDNPKLLLIVGGAGLAVNLVGLCLFHNHGHSHGGGGHGHSHGGGGHKSHDNHSENNSGHGPETDALVESKNLTNGTNTRRRDTSTCGIEIEDADILVEVNTEPGPSSSQLNMRGVFLHVLGDALGSVIVVISALLIWFIEADWKYYVDPAMRFDIRRIIAL
ncbi:hypothetical protein KUTeg_022898 [Tegillarca granosa]|uniref:Cation efflux protein transmembrane domain-containing protein n=1 Tax=Tegillarca granosa TaxID=220873 RepID=A0ABQ9E037_TEGGR|nr:hypothetical protein KUTeg_022898 [Tegillarca granosa]